MSQRYLIPMTALSVVLAYDGHAHAATSQAAFADSDYILSKVCLDANNNLKNVTPLNCTSSVGQLHDVTPTSSIPYMRSDYIAANDADITGGLTTSCKALYGSTNMYVFPLQNAYNSTGSINGGTTVPAITIVQWLSNIGSEYVSDAATTKMPENCTLTNQEEYDDL